MRKIIIDTDTATDDAIAIIMALKNKEFDIKAITTVAGNVNLDLATNNALYTCELCQKDIPVYKGESKPLKRKLETSKFFHGKDGMGDTGPYYPKRLPGKETATKKIISLVNKYPKEIEIIGIGPLTNIAKVFIQEPEILKKIKNLYIMGGVGEGKGNITEYAEFNFWVDPEAADIVLNSGIPIKMIAWDTTQTYGYIDKDNFKMLKKIETNLSKFAIDIQKRGLEYYRTNYNVNKIDLADPLAMSVMIQDYETVYKKCFISIKHSGEKRGRDTINYSDKGNISLASKISRNRFLKTLENSLV